MHPKKGSKNSKKGGGIFSMESRIKHKRKRYLL
jgi:hypothetical protein